MASTVHEGQHGVGGSAFCSVVNILILRAQFILHFRGEEEDTVTELAFLDARRLGRVKLCTSPTTEPPISNLGFDPILTMPGLEEFTQAVRKRACPIKALLLDQSFSAGVGNWVAGMLIDLPLVINTDPVTDEILYHSRVHPEHRCHDLSDADMQALHKNVQEVCKIAVAVNADDSKFPENWLFKHRWVCTWYCVVPFVRLIRSRYREKGRRSSIHSH